MSRVQREPLARVRGGQYRVTLYEAPPVVRPTKLAAGMSFTWSRSKHYARINGRELRDVEGPALHLIVKGTTVDMRSLAWVTERVPCPCCGAKTGGKLKLNRQGQLRLRTARRRRSGRLAA